MRQIKQQERIRSLHSGSTNRRSLFQTTKKQGKGTSFVSVSHLLALHVQRATSSNTRNAQAQQSNQHSSNQNKKDQFDQNTNKKRSRHEDRPTPKSSKRTQWKCKEQDINIQKKSSGTQQSDDTKR